MIYLDNGATSFPKPPGMAEVMKQCMEKYCGNPGRSGHYMALKTGEEVYKARKAVADLLGIVSPDRLVFTLNTTMALNMGIKGVLEPGDHVVTTAMEHNSVLRPLKAIEAYGVEHTIVKCSEDGTVSPENIRKAIRGNTRLVVCTHASNVTGTIQDTKAIGRMISAVNREQDRKRKVLFMVDAAQSAGSIPLSAANEDIDMIALPGHKGLLGPLGTGALYVKKGTDIYPVIEGGTGTMSRDRMQPLELPEGFESGTVNAPGIIGLGYSAEYVKKIGVENIRKYEEELMKPLYDALPEMKHVKVYGPAAPERRTAVVTFNITDGAGIVKMGCEEVAGRLAREYGIAVRGGYHCAGLAHRTIGTWDTGAVRISAGPFNTVKQIYTAIDAVYKISESI